MNISFSLRMPSGAIFKLLWAGEHSQNILFSSKLTNTMNYLCLLNTLYGYTKELNIIW